MKVLLIVMKERRAIIDGLYSAVADRFEHCDIHRLSDEQQGNLADYFEQHMDPPLGNFPREEMTSRYRAHQSEKRKLY